MKIAQVFDEFLPPALLPAVLAVWSNILAAHLIATDASPQWLVLILQLAAGAALCWSGMALADCFVAGREAGATAGVRAVPVRACALGGGLAFIGLVLAGLAGGDSLRIAIAVVVAFLAYYGLFRETLLGPVIAGATRFMYWMLGLAAVPLGSGHQALAIPVFLYAIALMILSDRETQGADQGTIRKVALLLGLAVLVIGELVIGDRLVEPLVMVAVVPAAGLVGYWLWRTAADGSPAAAQTMIARLNLGFIPLNALLLAGAGHWLLAPLLLLLLVPAYLTAGGRLPLPGRQTDAGTP